MKIRDNYTCPLEIVHDIIKGKWKPIIIFQLRDNSLSLAELRRSINGINEKMLLEQLHELIYFGILDKKTYSGYPLKVEYFLTQRGLKMLSVVNTMQQIGIEYMVENNMTTILDEKEIPYSQSIPTKK